MSMMLDQASAEQWVEDALAVIYQRIQQGKDVSPAARLALEGQVDLLLAFELLEFSWLRDRVVWHHRLATNEAPSALFWEWLEARLGFVLPLKMTEAPVYRAGS
ncbi:Uncharacterised protein [BD1-7 clade bacterium]|uniref:Uncharacterized protein n=1 Tax=BD1-7 clade bacterium TaxID=2029982 RepID=A0A5S9PU96_9GAMM|nr:Uncharacterised protein [BD1-7 clade bacterium]CAA0108003.1 Uncharacterised protein [BD1-7 clade bacterium]